MVRRLLIALPLAAIGALWFWWLILPWPVLLPFFSPGRTAFMDLRVREARADGRDYEIRRTWMPIEDIAPALQRAVIVAEDGRFPLHRGIDWVALGEELHYRADDDFSWFDPRDLRALVDAVGYYIRNRSEVRGRSTITQQVAKNLYFSADRSVLRKFEELIVARRLELFLSKQRILEIYLNIAEWGPGIFGAEAAARHYFDRSAARLSAYQAASLAATLPHPLTSNPARRPGRMAWRRDLILRLMGRGGSETVPLAPPPLPPLPTVQIDTIR
jgi:monofunctional biosynthetic peptidoglycan transglycosylase